VIASLFFALGSFALGAPVYIVVGTSISSWIICYGIVGSGIGFGAMFALFDWEHPSQLSAGFGSFVYMLHCTMLIFLNMIPAWIVLFVPRSMLFGASSPVLELLFFVVLGSIMLAVNHGIARWAMERGELRLRTSLR
jgi:glucan phosphoethanolaminetransferase (alkaline phosphatase superfamily)